MQIKSINGKNWCPRRYNDQLVSEIRTSLGISDLLAKIISRSVNSIDEAASFLNPKIKSLLPDPFHLTGMHEAVDRVIQAMINGEKICLFADYDVDGATSAATLKRLFDELKIASSIYIPDRILEGYGPNAEAMQKIKDKGIDLVITLDCGAVAFDALNYAQDIGLDVIIIDHHLSLENSPNVAAMVNPNKFSETSPYKYLAAVGVAFLFAVGLCKKMQEENLFEKLDIAKPNLMKYLDLVSLGTVCDVMPLIGLNRAFVAQGLKIAAKRQNIGYRALSDVAELDSPPNCYHLGYILGPRINAGGRVGKSDLGAKLLSCNDSDTAHMIAEQLDEYNQERKAIEIKITEEAKQQAQQQIAQPVILVKGDWHVGVIGIVAGRLKEQYHKPVIVAGITDHIAKASCRSIKGVDLGSKIIEAKNHDLVIAGGGHAMAAGFSAKEEMLDELHDFLCQLVQKELANSEEHLTFNYDLVLSSSAINMDLIEEINQLEPYGVGNPAPVIKFENVFILRANLLANKHAKIIFLPTKNSTHGKPIDAIIFNVTEEQKHYIFSKKSYNYDIIGKLKLNKWMEKSRIQFVLEDFIIHKNI